MTRRVALRAAWITTLLLPYVLLAGCAPSNLAEVIKEAGGDQATVCARVTTIYGTATYMRTNIHGGDVSCDTLGVKSTTTITVPVTITPSFQASPSPFGPGTPPFVKP